MIALVVLGWIACGVLAYGLALADWCGNYRWMPVRSHVGISAAMGILGPVGLVIALLMSNFAQHGMRWR